MAISSLRSAIDRLLQQDCIIVAIDGKCTSGKTTLASKLAEIYKGQQSFLYPSLHADSTEVWSSVL